MQQVYKAEDRSFQRMVALKVPKNESAEKRFDRSARVSARITHDNVAKTLDYFEEDSKPYLIEELIDGKDLSKLLSSDYAFFDPHLLAKFTHQLAKGIAAAHHADVIHRDLKPSNIMVSNDANISVVKITDFGIAKMAAQELEEAVEGAIDGDPTSLTSSNTAMGALPYMSPEMIDSPKSVGKPTDIWAAGAILYQLLAGRHPFGQGYKAVPRILEARLPDKPEILVRHSQFALLGQSLWELILMCLRKNPEDRPTADQVVTYCEGLFYSDGRRKFGRITSVRPGKGKWGFITDVETLEDVFYHEDSVYGPLVSQNMKVNYAAFDGEPYARAFPVLPMREDQE